MAAVPFSFHFDFEQALLQARDLQRGLQAGDPDAIQRLESHHPERLNAARWQLADAQHVVARDHGFESWAQLRHYAEPRPLYRSEDLADGQNSYITGRPWEEQERRLRRLAEEALSRCGFSPSPMSIAGQMGNFGYNDFALGVTTEGETPSHLVTVRYAHEPFPLVEVHRQVASLCAWLLALARDTEVEVQVPVSDESGEVCQLLDHRPEGPAAVCTVQRWVPGEVVVGEDEPVELSEDTLRALGELLGRVHNHGSAWSWPAGFNRIRIDWMGEVKEVSRDYWNARGDEKLSREELSILRRTVAVQSEFRQTSGESWGLTHGDFRAGNCVEHEGRYAPIDFDTCALSYQLDDVGWFLVDVDDPDMRGAFLSGYARVIPMPSMRSVEGALIAARTRRCAWGGPLPEGLIRQCEKYLSNESFLFAS